MSWKTKHNQRGNDQLNEVVFLGAWRWRVFWVMHEIDASFRRKLSEAREKQQRLLRRRIFGAAAACLVLAVAVASYFVFGNMPAARNRDRRRCDQSRAGEAEGHALRCQRHHRSGRRSPDHPAWLVSGKEHQAQGFRRPRRDEAARRSGLAAGAVGHDAVVQRAHHGAAVQPRGFRLLPGAKRPRQSVARRRCGSRNRRRPQPRQRPKKRPTRARTRCWCRSPGRTISKATRRRLRPKRKPSPPMGSRRRRSQPKTPA